MDPLSKFATCQKLDNYYETPDFDYQHVLRFMGFLEEHHDDYLTWLYKQSMCLHSGNTNEQLTAIPLEKEVTKMLSQAKFIYCADAGLGSYNIRKFNSMGGRAFIVTQSIKKLSAPWRKLYSTIMITNSSQMILRSPLIPWKNSTVTIKKILDYIMIMHIRLFRQIKLLTLDYMKKSLYDGSKALDALTQLTMLPLDRKHYRSKELNNLIKNLNQMHILSGVIKYGDQIMFSQSLIIF